VKLHRPRRARGVGLVVALLFGWSAARAFGGSGAIANPAGWPMVRAFASAALRPDLAPSLIRLACVSSGITLAFAAAGTALALVIGTLGGVLSSDIWWGEHRFAATICRGCVAMPRSLHEVVWGLLLLSCLGLTPLTAILALGIHYGAITARVTGETLDDTPATAFHALRQAGAPRLTALCYGLLPAAAPDLIAYGFYRFECSIRASVVLGMIGAGGLGFQVLLSMQSLRYGEVWTFIYALMVLCGLTDVWSAAVRRRRVRSPRVSLVLAALLIGWSLWLLPLDLSRLVSPHTYHLLSDAIARAFPPRPAPSLLSLCADTLAMSVLAIGIAFAAALVVALRRGVVSRLVLLLSRAASAPVWTLIALFVLFPGILPGAVGLAVFNFGVLGRLLGDAVEDLDRAPIVALDAAGARPWSVALYAVLPALRPRAITLAAYRWEECVRGTVLVGLVGAGGLGTLLTQQLASFDYRGVAATLGAFIAVTLVAEWLVRATRDPRAHIRDRSPRGRVRWSGGRSPAARRSRALS
jgi:phosphonate transport system permease protein